MQTSDQAFEAWLRSLPSLGYERQWVVNNIGALEKRFRATGGAPMPPCPEPSQPKYDPYRGL
ncbi:hypothetical protein [Novosphingobium soli]|uniref:Uncharacterized protein n=1 Tax=Novosphingobium soli TaxID=574956 RepID=A0ABV6CVG0_9SPHN